MALELPAGEALVSEMDKADISSASVSPQTNVGLFFERILPSKLCVDLFAAEN
jgi:hypothetical protein